MSRKPTIYAVIVLTLAGITATATAQHADKPKKSEDSTAAKLPACPVMGESIDFNVSTMTDDGPVYFCCKSCIKKYEKAPDKYADKVAKQRAALKKLPHIQVTCPISGEPVDKSAFAEQDGNKVYFCCNDCKAKFTAHPDAFKAKLAASYTYQTKCPVKNRDIDPAAHDDLPTGERVYFCCKDCAAEFLANPGKYAPKLAAQGVNINVKKLESAGKKDKP
jgi:YHS domain-containing protein